MIASCLYLLSQYAANPKPQYYESTQDGLIYVYCYQFISILVVLVVVLRSNSDKFICFTEYASWQISAVVAVLLFQISPFPFGTIYDKLMNVSPDRDSQSCESRDKQGQLIRFLTGAWRRKLKGFGRVEITTGRPERHSATSTVTQIHKEDQQVPITALANGLGHRSVSSNDCPSAHESIPRVDKITSGAPHDTHVNVPENFVQRTKLPLCSRGVQTESEVEEEYVPRKRNLVRPPTTLLEQEIADGEIIVQTGGRRVVKLKSGRIVKCGGGPQTAQEAATMKFIAERTSIPIPPSVDYVVENKAGYLFMDYVDGMTIGDIWNDLQEEQKTTILAELKGYLDQLRALGESDYIGSLDRGPCWDCRVVGYPCGPFDSEQLFNDHIVSNLTRSAFPERRLFLRKMLRDHHKMVFTHGDLHPGNILVKDGHIVAILDWEMAGWYPEHWEFCKAMWLVTFESDWGNRVCDFLRPYHYEYAVDQLLRSYSPVW